MKLLAAIILIFTFFVIRGFLVRCVKIYGHHVDGRCFFLGTGFLKTRNDYFEVRIRDSLLERNYTNVLDIVIPDFKVGRYDESILVVSTRKVRNTVLMEEVVQVRLF